jgi:peptidoglycan/xylan/chitin deacetylase (PgdA/CDA1 family)
MTYLKAVIRTVLKKPLGISFRFIPQVRRAMKRGLTVFLFHEVSDHPSQFAEEHDLAVSRKTFHRQVSWIQSHFNVIHPADILNNKPIPERAALISFDDGFLGAFKNGLAILEKLGLPSIFFLNMQAILEQKPILSAVACFLDKHTPQFSDFLTSAGVSSPFHLALSPSILNSYEKRYGFFDKDAVLDYQGQFADLNTVKKWSDKGNVFYGNHLFEHWNASALSIEELEEQYKKNEIALSQFKNKINLFAFTNGQPGTCFSSRDIIYFQKSRVGRIFSATGCINENPSDYLLDRISLGKHDVDEYSMWFKIGFGLVRKKLQQSRNLKV